MRALGGRLLLTIQGTCTNVFRVGVCLTRTKQAAVPRLSTTFFHGLINVIRRINRCLYRSRKVCVRLRVFKERVLRRLRQQLSGRTVHLVSIVRRLTRALPLGSRQRIAQLSTQRFRRVTRRFRRRFNVNISGIRGLLPLFIKRLQLIDRRIQRTSGNVRQDTCFIARIVRRQLFRFNLLHGLTKFCRLLLIIFRFLSILRRSNCSKYISKNISNVMTRLPPLRLTNRIATMLSLIIHAFIP